MLALADAEPAPEALNFGNCCQKLEINQHGGLCVRLVFAGGPGAVGVGAILDIVRGTWQTYNQ